MAFAPGQTGTGAWLDGDVVRVRGGWRGVWFRVDVPLALITSMTREEMGAACRGVRGFRGNWMIDVVGEPAHAIGSRGGLLDPFGGHDASPRGVRVRDDARLIDLGLARSVRGRCFFFPVRVRSLRVGVEDSAAFAAAVRRRRPDLPEA